MSSFRKILVLAVLLVAGCEEVIEVNLKGSESTIVIDGWLTNELKSHTVRVTQTLSFYDSISSGAVSDAIVYVTDSKGNSYMYDYAIPMPGEMDGYYFSSLFAGVENEYYTLHVQYQGEEYIGSDTLKRITSIDSLVVQEDTSLFPPPENDSLIYEVLLYASEPQETVDFYYFDFFRNGEPTGEQNQIFVFDDETLGESLDGLPSPMNFALGDTARVDILSLSRIAYVYYLDLANLVNNDNGLFSPPPANPRNNLSNGALGLWQVSAIHRGEVIIKE